MLGSFEDSEDLVQETLLRAWRNRASFQGRSTVRTWLYRIATNACLDALDRRPRRVMPADITPAWDPRLPPRPPPTDLPFLQPYPDLLLDTIPSTDAEPDVVVVSKENIELAFIAAIQYLPPRQRAILILRDVLDWSANETASLLDVTVPAVKSALQRARASLRQHLRAGPLRALLDL
jgi:RNA polymerase sigma-70 factor (ECF subfamily)